MGADVLISYVDAHDDAQETARWVETADRKAVLAPGDIQDKAHCRAVIQKAADTLDVPLRRPRQPAELAPLYVLLA